MQGSGVLMSADQRPSGNTAAYIQYRSRLAGHITPPNNENHHSAGDLWRCNVEGRVKMSSLLMLVRAPLWQLTAMYHCVIGRSTGAWQPAQ